MPADIVNVAEAVLADLNADPLTNFGRDFTAIRSNGEFEYKLEEGEFRVDVVPAGHPLSDAADRAAQVDHHVATQICVREGIRRVQGEFENDTVDPLRLILQKIQKHFVQRELSTLDTATWISSEYEVDTDQKMLREFSTYMGIVRVVYQVVG